MGETIRQEVAQDSEALADAAEENVQLANLYMGIIGRVVVEASKRGTPYWAVNLGSPMFTGMTMKVHVKFGSGIGTPEVTQFFNSRYKDIADYIMAKAHGLAQAVGRNPSMVKFLNAMLSSCEKLARHKGIPFKDLGVVSAVMDRDDQLIVELKDNRKETPDAIGPRA